METLIFIWDFNFIFETIKSYTDFHKILVIDKRRVSNNDYLKEFFNRILIVDDIFNKHEVEETIRRELVCNNIKGIYGTFEGVVEVAGYLRDKLNVPGLSEEQTIKVRDKYIMKKTLSDFGIKTAKIQLVNNNKDIINFISNYGYPVIIKPQNGAGTVNTFKIANEEEFNNFIETQLSNKALTENMVIEQFIHGKEYHCDSIVSEKREIVFSSVGEYLHNCIETINSDKPVGTIIYPYQNEELTIAKNIIQLNERIINFLGLSNTVCHLEVFVTELGEIYFGEIAARIGGGPIIATCIKNSYDVDIFKAYVDVEINNLKKLNIKKDGKFTGVVTFPTAKGKIIDISAEEDFHNIKDVVEVKIYNKRGDVIGSKESTFARTGYVVVENEKLELLKDRLFEVYNLFKLEVAL